MPAGSDHTRRVKVNSELSIFLQRPKLQLIQYQCMYTQPEKATTYSLHIAQTSSFLTCNGICRSL